MAEAVYAIDDFPADDLLWRIEWIGGVARNPRVASDPTVDVSLAPLPAGETNPLSEGSRSSQTKTTVKVGVGLLPIGSRNSSNTVIPRGILTEFPLPSVSSASTWIHNLRPEQELHKHTEHPRDHDQLRSA